MPKNNQIVAGADVPLETISRLLADEAVSAHGLGYVFDDRDRLIVHSDKAMMELLVESLIVFMWLFGGGHLPGGTATRCLLVPTLRDYQR